MCAVRRFYRLLRALITFALLRVPRCSCAALLALHPTLGAEAGVPFRAVVVRLLGHALGDAVIGGNIVT